MPAAVWASPTEDQSEFFHEEEVVPASEDLDSTWLIDSVEFKDAYNMSLFR